MKHDPTILPADRAAISGPDLATALRRALMVAERRFTIPVLGMCHIAATGGTLTLRSTDLETALTLRLPAPEATVAPFLISPRLLARIAKDATSIALEPDATGITIRADDLTARLATVIPPEDFPDFVFPTRGDQISESTASESDLHASLAAVFPCISTEETRYYLNGIYCHQPEGSTGLRMVATDGHRMALRETGMDWPHPAMILPTRAVQILRQLTRKGGNEPLRIAVAGGNSGAPRIRIEAEGWTLHTKTIDGTYPDYTRVIPKPDAPPKYSATLTLAALNRLPVIEMNAAKIDPASRTIQTKSPDLGTFTLPCDCAGEARAAYNLTYLRAFARTAPDGIIRLEGWDVDKERRASGPALIRTADPAMTQVLMSMRY
jgi:DNA polymerase III subunit beta